MFKCIYKSAWTGADVYQPHFPYVISLRSSINHHECLCKEIGLLKAGDSNNQREYEEKTFWHKNYSIQKVGWSEKDWVGFFPPINVVLLRCEDSSNMNSLRSPGFLVQQPQATCEQPQVRGDWVIKFVKLLMVRVFKTDAWKRFSCPVPRKGDTDKNNMLRLPVFCCIKPWKPPLITKCNSPHCTVDLTRGIIVPWHCEILKSLVLFHKLLSSPLLK